MFQDIEMMQSCHCYEIFIAKHIEIALFQIEKGSSMHVKAGIMKYESLRIGRGLSAVL
jgi:hypothetical protein